MIFGWKMKTVTTSMTVGIRGTKSFGDRRLNLLKSFFLADSDSGRQLKILKGLRMKKKMASSISIGLLTTECLFTVTIHFQMNPLGN